jgi:hypothetical protein
MASYEGAWWLSECLIPNYGAAWLGRHHALKGHAFRRAEKNPIRPALAAEGIRFDNLGNRAPSEAKARL